MRRWLILFAAALCAAANAQASAEPWHAPRTPWGDPDLRGTWPLQNINDADIRLQRAEALGEQQWLDDAAFAQRLARAEQSDARFSNAIRDSGTTGLADWVRRTPFARRSSLLVSPSNGRLPPLTPAAQTLMQAGRSSWRDGQTFDWLDDLDAFDRCITRGWPAVMLPQPYNNGLRLFQSPGFVAVQMEVFGTRVIPLGQGEQWPAAVRGWHGSSRGRWEGETLVIETTNIVAGDSVTRDMARRAAGPVPGRGNAVMPVGRDAQSVERLTMTGPDTIAYAITYTDPDVFTAPWTAAFEWTRDDAYPIYEYACHEGNETVRHVITTSRAERSAARR